MRELVSGVEERNYAKDGLTRPELQEILRAAPSVEAILNTRHAIAKERGWKDAPPNTTDFIQVALEENNLLRRPILIVDGQIVIGWVEDAIRAVLQE